MTVATATTPDTSAPQPLLEVEGLNAWYGESHVLHGIDLRIVAGETVAMLGRNGAGKTTTLKSIMGMIRTRTGSIRFGGKETIGDSADRVARRGVAICPEDRGIFAALSVRENLLLPPVIAAGGMQIDEICTLFPNLAERWKTPGTKLSGGEQQMLAIARILRTGARLLLLDEPTEGLAPAINEQIAKTVRILKQRGFTILLVEQNFRFARAVADRFYIVEDGKMIDAMDRATLDESGERVRAFLGV